MGKKPKVDWIYHYVANGVECAECGKVEHPFPEHICDAHTHGMSKYGHLEFQVVIDYGPKEVGRLLNTMAFRVQAGEKFKNGDVIKGLYLDCDVPLWEMSDSSGRSVLRLIIPDKQNRMPEESDEPYKWQMLCTQILYAGNGPAN